MILVAVGANLSGVNGNGPRASCEAAVTTLAALPHLRIVSVSKWYETMPIPRSDQPLYVNGVVRLDGTADPAWLLDQLHAIEARAGRVRTVANAARMLDLDLIAIDDLIRTAPDPVLPHPRAHLRAFVLAPLVDVAPDWVHPILGRTAADLLADLPDQGVTLLGPLEDGT